MLLIQRVQHSIILQKALLGHRAYF